jgi:glycosyltransferase involved in cell wall biosynthesis
MSKRQKNTAKRERAIRPRAGFDAIYERACRFAEAGKCRQSRRLLEDLIGKAPDVPRGALLRNDLAALAAAIGDIEAARAGFLAALGLDSACQPARSNLEMLEQLAASLNDTHKVPAPLSCSTQEPEATTTRVAILSFLFNWPSTGGGIVHTFELAQFLGRAGYEVQHFYPRFPGWEIGVVPESLPFASTALEFDETTWNVESIQARVRQAVEECDPDHVIITDSWNIKPLLAEAVRGFPYILRFQAMECLCPLNGVRLLLQGPGQFRQCFKHQLASPDICSRCVQDNGHMSGGLHQAERALSGVGTRDYYDRLVRALCEAEAVLVVNPLQQAMMSPYADDVRVVTAGMDPERFPWPWPDEDSAAAPHPLPLSPEGRGETLRVLFAGLVEEPMKGFDVLHKACSRLWQRRQDFELLATADPPGRVDAFTRFIGWQSQENLPGHLREAAMLMMPTIAQEALGRTAVEAMAAGRPVVASRLGGLPFTVVDGATGLLCEPGDVEDLARKIEMLLDDAGLRERLGTTGRRRFEEHYAWPVIIERHYRPLLGEPRKTTTKNTKSTKKSTEAH